MKGVFFIAALTAAIFSLGCRASAMVEYCPADLNISPVASMPGVYAMSFEALSARNVSGDVALQTDQGWYSVSFSDVPLTEFDEKWSARHVEFTRKEYLSDYLFVRFQQPVKLQSAFVNNAQTKGETVFAWDEKGLVSCAGLSAKQFSEAARRPQLARLNNPKPQPSPTSATTFLMPTIASAPGQVGCSLPFADASVTRAARAEFPEAARVSAVQDGNVLIEVAVSATGSLDDAWIYMPSGNRYLDAAALGTAKQSEYQPRRSFCDNVAGLYLFRVEYKSGPG